MKTSPKNRTATFVLVEHIGVSGAYTTITYQLPKPTSEMRPQAI